MTTLKLAFAMLLIGSSALAGGTSGGGVLPEAWVMQESAIFGQPAGYGGVHGYIFSQGVKPTGEIKLKFGTWSNSKTWKTQDFETFASDLSPSTWNAIRNSEMSGGWAPLVK